MGWIRNLGFDSDLFWPIGIGVIALVTAFGMLDSLGESRATIDHLEHDHVVFGRVERVGKTLTTPYLHKTGVVAYYAYIEETSTDSDGDSSTSVVETQQQVAPFHLRTDRGVVSVGGRLDELRFPGGQSGSSRTEGDREFFERTLSPGAAVSVLNPNAQGSGLPETIVGSVRLYRGTPRAWLQEVRDEALWSIFIGVVGILVAALALGIVLLVVTTWLRGLLHVDGKPARGGLILVSDLLTHLRSADLDEIAQGDLRPHLIKRALSLLSASVLWTAFFAVITFLVAAFVPSFVSLAPVEGEEALRVGFLFWIVTAGAGLGLIWVVWEIVAIVRGRWQRRPMDRVSDAVLQCLVRVAPVVDPEVGAELDWPERSGGPRWLPEAQEHASVKAELMGGGDLQLSFRVTKDRRDLTATVSGRRSVRPLRVGWTHASGCWVSRAGDDMEVTDGDVHQAMADALAVWLGEVGLTTIEDIAASQSGEVQLVRAREIEVADAGGPRQLELRSRLTVRVPEVPRRGAVWLKRNGGSLGYLAVAALAIFTPLAVCASMLTSVGANPVTAPGEVGEMADVMVLLLMFIPSVLVSFRPPDLTPRRVRRVRLHVPKLRVSGESLDIDGTAIALDQPFVVLLSRQGGADGKSLLTVELRQGSQTDARRAGFSVVARHSQEVASQPELVSRWPLAPAEPVVEWLWPLVRGRASAYREPIPWDLRLRSP